MNDLKIGCHLSVSKGYLAMGKEAMAIDANTFQFFTRNPRGGKAKELNIADAAGLVKLMAENHFAPAVAHAPYTLNPCSADPGLRDFALMLMKDDLAILDHLPNNYYNFHPGSHVGQGVDVAIKQIAFLLDQTLHADLKTTVLLETMSGKGSEVGRSFEELRAIIDHVAMGDVLGVCLDTCHVYSAGYDIVNDLDGVLTHFDQVIGLGRLKAIHLNDSMMPFDSNKDRHAKIGEGTLGLDAIVRVINHPALKHLPFCLETPNELDGYAAEIRLLRDAYIA